jgi:hypothetical protein
MSGFYDTGRKTADGLPIVSAWPREYYMALRSQPKPDPPADSPQAVPKPNPFAAFRETPEGREKLAAALAAAAARRFEGASGMFRRTLTRIADPKSSSVRVKLDPCGHEVTVPLGAKTWLCQHCKAAHAQLDRVYEG